MYGINKLFYLLTTLIFTLCVVPTEAVKIGKGLVRIDDKNFGLFSDNIPLNMTDTKISFGFILNDENINDENLFLKPSQVAISLSNENFQSEMYLTPKLLQEKVYEINIPVSKISNYLLSSEKIDITIITADEDKSLNAIIKAGSLLPSKKLRLEKSIDLPVRFGVKDQIFHIFRSDPKNLPSFISTQFVFLLLISFIVLLLAWNYFEAANINNLLKFNPMVSLFILSIFVFEYYFFDYYLGTSIFITLKRFTFTSISALYFGSKTLKDMYKLRTSNLR